MIWISTSINVDIDTGEIITNYERNRNYLIIKKLKDVKYNKNKTRGTITFTNKCQRNAQGELPFNNP